MGSRRSMATEDLLRFQWVNDPQCAQLFQALRYLGRTVEFLWFEGETHGFSRIGRPVNRVERLRRIVDWFQRYL